MTALGTWKAVSYTHLDVYKRQAQGVRLVLKIQYDLTRHKYFSLSLTFQRPREAGTTGKDQIKTQVALPSTRVDENSSCCDCRRMAAAVIVPWLVLTSGSRRDSAVIED